MRAIVFTNPTQGECLTANRWLSVCLLFVFFALLSCCCSAGSGLPAVEAAGTEEKIVRVGYFDDNDAMQTGFSDGQYKSGYSYAYIQEIARHTGWKYQYVYGSWDEMLEKLSRGEIDILSNVPYRQGETSRILFPRLPMGREEYHILVHEDQSVSNMGNPESLSGMRIGVKADSNIELALKDFVAENRIDCKIIPIRTAFSRIEMFRHRRLDALASFDYNMVDGVKSIINFGGTSLYLCVTENRPDLLEELNRAQEEIFTRRPSFDKGLHEAYLSKQYTRQGLNDDEKDWLYSRKIRIGCLQDYLPYSGYDKQQGQWAGVVVLAAKRLEEYTGCKVDLMPFDSRLEMIEALKEGYVDAAFPVFNDLWYEEQEGIFGTGEFASDNIVIAYKDEHINDTYRRIGIIRRSAPAMEIVRKMFPKSELYEYNTLSECIEAVGDGKVTGAVVSGSVLYRYREQFAEFNDLHITNAGNIDYGFVTRRENRVFFGILSRCLSEINPNDINDAIIGSTYVAADYSLASFIRHNSGRVTIAFSLFILLLIINFYLYWRSTQRHNAEMAASLEREENYSRQLKNANESLRRQMEIIRTQKGIITIDALTQINNRYQLEKFTGELFAQYDSSKGQKIYLAICDLDKFKSINDNFGHKEGDKALVTVANAMKGACAGTSAFIARYGGDEFIIIVKSDDDRVIREICQKVEERLAQATEELPYKLSASIGIAECSDQGESFESLFNKADKELYRKKEARS